MKSDTFTGSSGKEYQLKLWEPLNTPPPRASEDLVEAAPTRELLKSVFDQQARRKQELIDAPLRTEKMRSQIAEDKLRAKLARWPTTCIRVRFADRSQMEGVLPSLATLTDLYDMVGSGLTGNMEFVLYQSPPRRDFKLDDASLKNKSLAQLELTPMSSFYIKFADDKLNATSTQPPLQPRLFATAERLRMKQPEQKPAAPPPSSRLPSGAPSGSSTLSKEDKENKMRKLLDIGKKK